MKAHQRTIGKNDEWITPRWILDALGKFDLDPCAAVQQPWATADTHYTCDGLNRPWVGRVWCNPPFNRYERPKWMARMAKHNNGIMLVPAALETAAFDRYVWGRSAGVLALSTRPHFCYIDGTQAKAKANSGCTIALIAYGRDNLIALKRSALGAVLVQI